MSQWCKYHLKLAVGLKVEVSLRTNYYNHELTTEESRPVYSVIPQRMDFYYSYCTQSVSITLLHTWYRVSTQGN